MTSRNYVFTVPCTDSNPLLDCYEWPHLKYAIYQVEVSNNTGFTHYQGYVEFTRPKSFGQVHLMDGMDSAHLEPRKGTRDQARAYCCKLDTAVDGPFEFGEWVKGQGERADLAQLRDMLKEGKTERDVLEVMPEAYFRYHVAIGKARALLARSREDKTKTIFIYGQTGVGKSRRALNIVGPTGYWKQPNTQWWDGYDGKQDVVIDDYKGWLTYTELLRLLDRYPLPVQVKGGQVNFNSSTIVITSCVLPWQWYSDKVHFKWEEFARRVDQFLVFDDKESNFVEMTPAQFHSAFFIPLFVETTDAQHRFL